MKKCLKGIQREKSGGEWQNKSISFSEIQHIFRENNIFDEKISIEHEGELYRLWCSDQSFIIYRVNCQPKHTTRNSRVDCLPGIQLLKLLRLPSLKCNARTAMQRKIE